MTTNPSTTPRFGYLPTPAQELLLKAALFRDDRAAAAWRDWQTQVDLIHDHIDAGTFRLLPLLHMNLKAQGVEDEHTQRLKGIYRKSWYENQMRFVVLAQVLALFAQAGIPTMILKGAALSLLHYQDMGARPMNDADVLVPTDRAAEAIALLHEHGWREQLYDQNGAITPAQRAVLNAWGFMSASRQPVDLHWHALLMGCFPGADDDFWRDARPAQVNGIDTTAQNAADLLFHICAHGSALNDMPPIRWVSDAWMVLQTTEALDWDKLLRDSRKFHATLPLRDMLDYLAHAFGAQVPHEVIEALDRAPVTDTERRTYVRFTTQTNSLLRKAGRHMDHYARYKRLWRENTREDPPAGMLDFMKESTRIRSAQDAWQRFTSLIHPAQP